MMDRAGRSGRGSGFLHASALLWVPQGNNGQPVSFWDPFSNHSLAISCMPSSICAVDCCHTKMVPSLKDVLSLVGEPEVRMDLRQNVNSVVQCAQSFQHMSPVEKHKS